MYTKEEFNDLEILRKAGVLTFHNYEVKKIKDGKENKFEVSGYVAGFRDELWSNGIERTRDICFKGLDDKKIKDILSMGVLVHYDESKKYERFLKKVEKVLEKYGFEMGKIFHGEYNINLVYEGESYGTRTLPDDYYHVYPKEEKTDFKVEMDNGVLQIPNDVTKLTKEDLAPYKDAKEVILPRCLKEIKTEAFEDFKNLEKIEIPSCAISGGEDIFKGCDNLKEIKNFSNIFIKKEQELEEAKEKASKKDSLDEIGFVKKQIEEASNKLKEASDKLKELECKTGKFDPNKDDPVK